MLNKKDKPWEENEVQNNCLGFHFPNTSPLQQSLELELSKRWEIQTASSAQRLLVLHRPALGYKSSGQMAAFHRCIHFSKNLIKKLQQISFRSNTFVFRYFERMGGWLQRRMECQRYICRYLRNRLRFNREQKMQDFMFIRSGGNNLEFIFKLEFLVELLFKLFLHLKCRNTKKDS